MQVTEALTARKSVRAYLNKPVSQQQIIELLDAARCAPSGSNTQPWKVVVLSGEQKNILQQKLENAYLEGIPPKTDYIYYPTQWKEPYQSRRFACGLQLYKALNINRTDKQQRTQQWIANYHSFGAPVLLLFFMDNTMQTGSYLDYGMFIQSLMLAAVEQGLATCAQAALCDYSDIIRHHLNIENDQLLICGMALGYEDTAADINSYRTPRAQANDFTRFI